MRKVVLAFILGLGVLSCSTAPAPAPSSTSVEPAPEPVDTDFSVPIPDPTEPEPIESVPSVITVHAGSFCSPVGSTGETVAGTPMTCKGPGRPRWRKS